tara:strand:+ start:686 stop:1075 length:390 start_codon:yes stop_codon:yes gene_type:complete
MATLFTKIIQGEIPSFKLYEDEWTYSFLDIRPVQPGHALVIPKLEIDHFIDVPEPHYSKMFEASKTVSIALQRATGCKRVGVAVIGYEVPHCHIHLIPSNSMAELAFENAREMDMALLKEWQQKILDAF